METASAVPQAEEASTVYETSIAVVDEPKGMLAPEAAGSAAPLDAHHKMLHEGSILSSHFKSYQQALSKYTAAASKFMHAADDFIISAGQPAKQHEALFRHDMQRKLIAAGSDGLTAALQEKLAPAFKVWLGVYDECKGLLPEVERLRRDAEGALARLQHAKKKVLEAEAASPLVSGQQLQDAGQLPRVLVQGTAGGLVATPAGPQRQEMYRKETEYTDASLAFELAEKVLRDKLGWLMQAGAGLKGTAAAALGHALRAAAAEGQRGQAPGGTAAAAAAAGVGLRAPGEELLEPFPAHVLARLAGQHLPTLQAVVMADASRLASVVAAKEEAVLLPAVLKHLGQQAGKRLQAQHQALAAALAHLGQTAPDAAGFDLALLEVLEAVDSHVQDLETSLLPELAAAPSLPLQAQQDLAKRYQRAAAAAPTRPHGWFLGAPSTTAASKDGGGGSGVRGAASAAVAATKEALRKMVTAPVKAGVAAVDAAADVARFGPGKVPEKLQFPAHNPRHISKMADIISGDLFEGLLFPSLHDLSDPQWMTSPGSCATMDAAAHCPASSAASPCDKQHPLLRPAESEETSEDVFDSLDAFLAAEFPELDSGGR
ncbi:hypothetical protein OEZ86_002591 [Tetradesmus obliquus]|nr:hypothetical protein OEZ86_002591 [Tetradesmus obliquus]